VADTGGQVSLVPVPPLSYVSLSHHAIKYCLGDPCATFVDCDKINIVNLELTTTVNLGLARPTISDQPNENGLLGFESLEIIQPLEFFRRFSEISSLCPHWRHTPCDDLPICLQEVFALCGIKSRPGAKNMFDYSRILTKQKHKSVTSSWNLMHSDNENEKNSKKRACDSSEQQEQERLLWASHGKTAEIMKTSRAATQALRTD